MHTIKAYQHTLNKTINIQNALVSWQSYSDEMYKIYKPYLLNKKVIIIGAGHITDFPMEKILNQVTSISLYDIDKEAMSLGLKAQNISSNKVTFITKDITCLDDVGFYKQVILLLQAKDLEGIKRFFRIVSHMNIDVSIDSKYDLLIISPFYTQLLLPQYLAYLNEFIEDTLHNEYIEPLLSLLSLFIDKINNQLLFCLNESGKIIVISDYLEFMLDDSKYIALKNKNNQSSIDKYYEDYLMKYGQGLGPYGLEDLVEKTRLIHQSWHWWPFNGEKELLVKIGIMGKMKVEENDI